MLPKNRDLDLRIPQFLLLFCTLVMKLVNLTTFFVYAAQRSIDSVTDRRAERKCFLDSCCSGTWETVSSEFCQFLSLRFSIILLDLPLILTELYFESCAYEYWLSVIQTD